MKENYSNSFLQFLFVIVRQDSDHAEDIHNKLEILQQLLEPAFFHSPMQGAKIVTEALTNKDIYNEW